MSFTSTTNYGLRNEIKKASSPKENNILKISKQYIRHNMPRILEIKNRINLRKVELTCEDEIKNNIGEGS